MKAKAQALALLIEQEARAHVTPDCSIASIRILEMSPWKVFHPYEGSGSAEAEEKARDILFDMKMRLDLASAGGRNPVDNLKGIVERMMREHCPQDYALRSNGVGSIISQALASGAHPSVEEICKVVAAFALGTWEAAPGLAEGWAEGWETWAKAKAGSDDYALLALGVGHAPPTTDGPMSRLDPGLSYHEAIIPFSTSATVDVEGLVKEALEILSCYHHAHRPSN